MIITPVDSFTRPNDVTPYTANDLVANSVVAASVIPLSLRTGRAGSGRGSIRRARLWKSTVTVANASFALHIFNATAPVMGQGDNGVFTINTARTFLGTIPIDMTTGSMVSTADVCKAGVPTNDINFDLSVIKQTERRLFGYLQALGAYVPGALEVFEVELEIYSDA